MHDIIVLSDRKRSRRMQPSPFHSLEHAAASPPPACFSNQGYTGPRAYLFPDQGDPGQRCPEIS